ncbi:hypothetical protein JXA05_01820 [Candidatus Peregrinibacteria bacterium]|nr:hypothetical protein [Candidatus Peregrinibacteria bacterium]
MMLYFPLNQWQEGPNRFLFKMPHEKAEPSPEAEPNPKTQADLEAMHPKVDAAVEAALHPADLFSGQGEILPEKTGNVKKAFEKYVEALHLKYTKKKDFRVPIFYPSVARKAPDRIYFELSDTFRAGMKSKMAARLENLEKTKTMTSDSLRALEAEFAQKYEQVAGNDGNPESISLADLGQEAMRGKPKFEMLQAIAVDAASDADCLSMMESMFLMNRETWKELTETTRDMIIESAERDGAETAFVKAANEYREKNDPDLPPFTEFRKTVGRDAVDYFRQKVDEAAETGAAETVAVFDHFMKGIKNPALEKLEAARPPSLQPLIYRERQFLLMERTRPWSAADRIIVEFVRADKKGRQTILEKKSGALFKAVKNAQKHYPKYYRDNFQQLDKKLSLDPMDLERETPHLQAARVQALILLADEAEWVIGNYGLKEKFDAAEPDKAAITPGLGFKDTWKGMGAHQRYISDLERGGFSASGLFTTGLRIYAAFTVAANVLNAYKDAEGKNFFEKIPNAFENAVANPYIYAGAGAFWASGEYKRTPEIANYLKAGPYERKIIETKVRLKRLGDNKDVGIIAVRGFIQSGAEWEMMEQLEPGDIKKIWGKR